MALNRLADTRRMYEAAKAQGVEAGEVTRIAYLVAFLEDDHAAMAQMADLLEHQAGYENAAVLIRAQTKTYYGRVRDSRSLSQVLLDTAQREKRNEAVGNIHAGIAVDDALLGFANRSQQHAEVASRYGAEGAALAFALAGNTSEALRLSKPLNTRAESDPDLRDIRLPELFAVMEIHRGDPARAVELLEPVKRFEEGWSDSYWAAYLRGQAYLAAGQGAEAAEQFQNVVDHRGLVQNALFGALAPLGLARSYALQGDPHKARSCYDDFFALWKDADSDIPLLKQARVEYSKLP
jgi:tetratricopeptide (TPR) repeat protein